MQPIYETDTVRIIPGVGPTGEAHLLRLGIHTLRELLEWYPRQYIDASKPVDIAGTPAGELVAIRATVLNARVIRTRNRGMTMVEATVTDHTEQLTLRWFNQPYITNRLPTGSEHVFVGVISLSKGKRAMISPIIESEPRILPVYAQTTGVSSRQLRTYTQWAVEHVTLKEDTLPREVREKFELVDRARLFRSLHIPQEMQEAHEARRSIAFREAFWFFSRNILTRQQTTKVAGVPVPADATLLADIVSQLPFTLTAGQKRAVWDIAQDMATGRPMTRLLNGDVGSGKTVVAALSAALVAQAGYQTVVLVPTEVLAKQHRESIAGLLASTGLRVATWTAAQKDSLENVDVVIGTHAVLQDAFTLPRLGFVVIDEQHRFGVRQRKLLRQESQIPPHVLSMTATPIPRTLSLVLYGDLPVSVLPEKPSNRLPIVTEVVRNDGRAAMHVRIVDELAQGHAVFILCSLIEEKPEEASEATLFRIGDTGTAERKTVLAEVERLRAEHPEYGVIEALHGRMKPAEKREIMDRVSKGEVQVLVATSVIEVGIDVPHATVMVVEGAERFGLAQLHQVRGRVGRSHRQSYCFLCPTVWNSSIAERMAVLVENESGFAVAERDLALRGPGDVSGLAQSGLPDFQIASPTDVAFLGEVKGAAEAYISEHPEFLHIVETETYSKAQGGLE